MDHLYLLDKPVGMTSFFALKVLKKKLDFPKLGHAGTLDPLASGLLLVATGNYTKLLPYLEDTSKEYEFTVELDGVTDSYDLGCPIKYISKKEKDTFKKILTQVLIANKIKAHFTGIITQTPPVYSAVKVDGKSAVRRVRAGESIILKSRTALIHSIEILAYSYPHLHLRAKVSSGTYIRSIAHDLGQILGCGGYVSSLRRIKIGNLDLSLAQEVDFFDGEKTLDTIHIFDEEKYLEASESEKLRLETGLPIIAKNPLREGENYFIVGSKKIEFIVKNSEGKLFPKRKI